MKTKIYSRTHVRADSACALLGETIKLMNSLPAKCINEDIDNAVTKVLNSVQDLNVKVKDLS